ncbi:hypothetical protein Gogos_015179 [Gossypium gossypioides]|uniref:RNase H type-1 domain-containing protein n=1 Tax=Gossypium gossypioides TaxID=34282 RepID=A0A7J9C0U1_GOSGO|nr:hypothetical protein [Gossypium gossypioides]
MNTPKWRCPKEGYIEVNFDAAFSNNKEISCSGILLRDSRGDVIASKITLHERISSPFATKARLCVEALRLCLDLNVQNLEVEGDSLTVIKKATKDETDFSEISGYMEDVKRLSKVFQSCTFLHVERSANEAANQLAREGLRQK